MQYLVTQLKVIGDCRDVQYLEHIYLEVML